MILHIESNFMYNFNINLNKKYIYLWLNLVLVSDVLHYCNLGHVAKKKYITSERRN